MRDDGVRRFIDSDTSQSFMVDTREDSHRDYFWFPQIFANADVVNCFRGSFHHLAAARCVDVENRNAEPSRFNPGHRHGVRYIVILQIEKNAAAAPDYLSHHVGT